jgi:adenosylcobinamide-phosphate synthase
MLMALSGDQLFLYLLAIALLPLLLLLLALWLDRQWGEPRAVLHPVVWMGHYLRVCGSLAVRYRPAPAFVLGALAWWLGALAAGAMAWAAQTLLVQQLARLLLAPDVVGGFVALVLFVFMAWLLKCMLSWRMLRSEVEAVEAALGQSLQAGRERLSWLVSRDTSRLSESEVRESAIESLAENLNDSVVAPIFWFVFLGLPGAVVYRFANTADAMWGYRGVYRGQNWEWAGKWAAQADDALSWLPARLTAVLIWLMAGGFSFAALRREAAQTPSPNSGWPMAAMALALDVRLCKPGVYTLNAKARAPEASDTVLACVRASKTMLALVPCALIAIVLIAIGVG